MGNNDFVAGDELLLSNTQKDVDEFFEHEKVSFNCQLKQCAVALHLYILNKYFLIPRSTW